MTIKLDPFGQGFVLRRTTEFGETTMHLSEDDVLSLGQSALAFQQSIMSRHRPGALFVTPVSKANAGWDALRENILVEMRFQPSGNLVFAVPPDCLRTLAAKIEGLLAGKPASQLTRQ